MTLKHDVGMYLEAIDLRLDDLKLNGFVVMIDEDLVWKVSTSYRCKLNVLCKAIWITLGDLKLEALLVEELGCLKDGGDVRAIFVGSTAKS